MLSDRENKINELTKKLVSTKERIAAQERSLQKSSENVKTGGTDGFIPSSLRTKLLGIYKKEAEDLERQIKNLEESQEIETRLNDLESATLSLLKNELETAKGMVKAQQLSIQSSKAISRMGGCGGIVPPYVQTSILNHYQKKVSELEALIENIEKPQPEETKSLGVRR